MTNRVNSSLGYGPVPPFPGKPSAPAPTLPWSACPPQNDREAWAWARRGDLTQIAVPFVMALMRSPEQHAGGGEPWTPEGDDPEAHERAIVEKAARLALLLQDALDRAKPRPPAA